MAAFVSDAQGSGVAVIDIERAERAIAELLQAFGQDVGSDGLKDTPRRVAKAWEELLSGYEVDTREVLARSFAEGYDELVLLKGVPFVSVCEHHLMPFVGSASVAYVPNGNGNVVGLSKLARIVEAHSRRLQIQERLTAAIAGDIESALEPKGVAVVVEAEHSCMSARGVRKQGSIMVTSSMLGVFREKPEARAEVMGLMGR